MDNWLSSSKASTMLESLGTGLGKGVDGITSAIEKMMDKIKWDEVGSTFEKVGDAVGKVIDKITSSPQFKDLLDELPNIIDKILKNEAIKLVTEGKTNSDLAQGKVGQYASDWTEGHIAQLENMMGIKPDWGMYSDTGNDTVSDAMKSSQKNDSDWLKSKLGFGFFSDGNLLGFSSDNHFATDTNASTYLAQNSNLNDDQRDQLKNMIRNDSVATYNTITIGEIKADSFDEIMQSIQQAQANQK
jgi:hypothetical protein